MRLNYYEFPEGTDDNILKEYCEVENCIFSYKGEKKTGMELFYILTEEDGMEPGNAIDYMEEIPHKVIYERKVSGISVTTAKQLLKQYGGIAYTYHCERDGTVFDVTPIKLKGNNSRFKYSHHL